MSELFLVRHGETTGLSSVRLLGATDVPLSDLGREQMRRAGKALKQAGVKFRKVFTSPLSRSREGARIILQAISEKLQPEPEVVEGFREINFGKWEGWTYEEIKERDPENYACYRTGSLDAGYPEGDTRGGFRERIGKTAKETFSDSELPSLAVLHKGVNRVILVTLLGVPFNEMRTAKLELGSITRLRRTPEGGWAIVEMDVVEHLGDTRIPGS